MNMISSVDLKRFLRFYFAVVDGKYVCAKFEDTTKIGIYACLYALLRSTSREGREVAVVSHSIPSNAVMESAFLNLCSQVGVEAIHTNDGIEVGSCKVSFLVSSKYILEYSEVDDVIFNDCVTDKDSLDHFFNMANEFERRSSQVVVLGRDMEGELFSSVYNSYQAIEHSEGNLEVLQHYIEPEDLENVDYTEFSAFEV